MTPRDFDPTETSAVTYWKSQVRRWQWIAYVASAANLAIGVIVGYSMGMY